MIYPINTSVIIIGSITIIIAIWIEEDDEQEEERDSERKEVKKKNEKIKRTN